MKVIKNRHLTDEALKAFGSGQLDEEQSAEFAGHAAECAECAARMVEAIEPCSMKPPKGFAEAAALRIESELGQKRREFRIYCARIAACVAVVFGVSVAGFIYMPAAPGSASAPAPTATEAPAPAQKQTPAPGEDRNLSKKMDDFFSGIVDSIINSEDSTDDKTTK
jgi:anti-sigma factor RsiW